MFLPKIDRRCCPNHVFMETSSSLPISCAHCLGLLPSFWGRWESGSSQENRAPPPTPGKPGRGRDGRQRCCRHRPAADSTCIWHRGVFSYYILEKNMS